MDLRAYFMVTANDNLTQREFIKAMRDVEDTPGVEFVDPVIGSRDMVIMVNAPTTIDALVKKIQAKPWVKDIEVLKIVDLLKVWGKGGGACATGCPNGGFTARHFTTEQIISELKGVLM